VKSAGEEGERDRSVETLSSKYMIKDIFTAYTSVYFCDFTALQGEDG
jgi:hypothetical protein